jgi:hypothetical protein
MTHNKPVFRSFWQGGFECSSHINSAGMRLDMTAALQHDLFCAQDYRRLTEVGIFSARDGLRWHLIDRGGEYDWSSWIPMLEAARDEGVQVIWDLFHYGWPDYLDIMSTEFVDRFALFCAAAARIHCEHTDEIPFYAPMNEISFFAWAATRDLMFPHAYGHDGEMKRQVVRAAIAAIQAIRTVDSRARFVSPEPLIHNVAPRSQPWNTGPAAGQRASQFEAWDMMTGRAAPELGGDESYLDLIGLNFYAANEWEVPGGRKLHWDAGSNDPRWMPLHKLLAEVYAKYKRPLLIAETSHYGIGRADWIDEISQEIRKTLQDGIPLLGACLYPILDRFDWEDRTHWHNCGLWDMKSKGGTYQRVLNETYAEALQRAQKLVEDSSAELSPNAQSR